MFSTKCLVLFTMLFSLGASAAEQSRTVQAQIADGTLEGVAGTDGKVQAFKGIPYAAPPVGPLRWKAPQPVQPWTGVRKAAEYGPRCMQGRIYPDMVFRDSGPSEDCLYLNVWTPAAAAAASSRLPVMVWIYGGGFAAGASSEPRQDGGNLAKHGVVAVSMNYRLGIFGFFSHPELTKESDHGASGNYGLLDQAAALQWVRKNISAFGGDPDNITIFGESAGSFSVSALMASPLSRKLIGKAIGESGAFFSRTLSLKPLTQSEQADAEFARVAFGTSSLEALRAKSADEVLNAALKQNNVVRFSPNIDGYFLPQDVSAIYASGQQSHVPLLAGWNADEGSYGAIFGKGEPTAQNFVAYAQKTFGSAADQFLKLYPASNDEQAKRSAQDLAGDQFIAYSTWKWLDMQGSTGDAPVYRYRFEDAPPMPPGSTEESRGAYHSAEIEFVFGVLPSKPLPWRPGDSKLSQLMSAYWTNFAKNGNPNGPGLPPWPQYDSKDGYEFMHLNFNSGATKDQYRDRYEFLDRTSRSK